MAHSSWLFLFLFVGTRAQWNEERPVLATHDGHLVISSAKDRNITLRTFGAGSTVNINDINLVDVSIDAKKAAELVKKWETEVLGGLTREVFQMSSGLSAVQQRLANLDFGSDGTANSSSTRPGRPSASSDETTSRVVHLTNRLTWIERSLRLLRHTLRQNRCNSSPCKHGGTCIPIYNSFLCLCPKNWEGMTCSDDVDECEIYESTDLGCQNGATCTNKPGSYRCDCPSGWHGIHCNTKLSTCEAQDSTELCGHGTCVPKSGNPGFTCICDQGWETDGSSPACRKDVNECAGKHPACSMYPLVPCFNEDGGYRCGGCPAGYTGNGHHCSDINECLVDNGGCSTSPRVDCVNTVGSWNCGPCPAGYQGDGVTCTYVGLCRINNGGCSPLASCVDSSGYVQCNCMSGYHGTGVGAQGCQAGAQESISPCSNNPCVHGTCLPNGAHFLCRCNPGYTGATCASQANPCSPNPCLNGGSCSVGDSGTVTCKCTSAFLGPKCETQRQSCSALYKNPSGNLEYPANGLPYEHGLNCAFVILTNVTMVLNVTFTRFDFEKSQNCRFDFLQIHDGMNAGAHQIGRFCGTELPFGGTFTTTHNAVYFWLRTDSSDARRGFALSWESVAPVCGGLLTEDHGRIASPGSPGNYPHNRDCEWLVVVDPGRRIQFHFYSVMMEEHPTCDYDYLEINETTGNRDVQLGLYCNHTHPAPLITSGSSAKLHFHSDGAGTDTGFQISYSTIEGTPGCGGIHTADHGIVSTPGYPANYPSHVICYWRIQLPKGEKIRLTWLGFDVERQQTCAFDAVEVFAGPDIQSPVIGRYCGNNLPSSVVVDSNVALIVFSSDYSRQRPGFQLKYETVCGGRFLEPTGILHSPYYPENYPGSRTCIYEIIQPPGKGIALAILDMEIEAPIGRNCYFDGLYIYDGDNDNSTLLTTLCGSAGQIPSESLYSSHNYMYLKFITDGSTHNRGFLANYTTIDRRCGGLLKEPSGLLRSHLEGDRYNSNEDCTWTLKAPRGHVVQLSFTSFNLEDNVQCFSDYVEIFDTDMDNQKMGRFCGTSIPPTLTSQGQTMTVKFRTDYSVSREGFLAHYVFVDASKVCGGHYFTLTGLITSPNYPGRYPPNKECVWVISAPQKQQVILTVNEFEIEGLRTCYFDYIEIRNGASETSPLIGKYCGTNIPRRIKSLTHQIYLKFVTDSSRQMGGFNITWDSSSLGCGGVLNGSRGEIISPGYPQPYDRLANCLWTIAVSAGSVVQLVIVDFELEEQVKCRYDYIEVSTGADERRTPGTRYCGKTHPSLIMLDSNLVTIRFRSDYGNSGRGFHIRYETLCQNTLRGFDGVIESPNFPEDYPSFANCTWIIEAPRGNKINVTFSDFKLEGPGVSEGANCSFDYLKISEGEDGDPHTDLGVFCGTDLPPRISSSTSELFVHFRSDRMFGFGGFRLEWVTVGCGGHLIRPTGEFTTPGYPDSYPLNTECDWLIEVDHGHSVQITFPEIHSENSVGCQFDKIEMYAGPDDKGPKIAEICHAESSVKYTSSSNKMFVRFSSDYSYNGKGFKAEYKSVDLQCGGEFSAPDGFIHSANYPLNYPNNQFCEWLISVDKNHLVNLTFTDFDVEDTTNCTDDYVKVFDGGSRDDVEMGTFCKTELPPSIISTGNTILVVMRSDSLVTAKGFQARFHTACGARIVAEGEGTLVTPSLMTDEVNCTWTIVAKDPADHVTLNFFYMELGESTADSTAEECEYRYLEVFEGDDTSGPSRLRWCTSKSPPAITSTGFALTIHLYASWGGLDDRFGATYSVLDSTCGGEHLSAAGRFSSPNYPASYMPNATCVWLLKTTPGNRIKLTFAEFELEQSPNCDRDYVEVRHDSGMGELVGVYCSELPQPIESSRQLWVKFRSDEEGTAKGFLADYAFLHGNEITGMRGEIASPLYPRLWKAADTIHWRITVGFGMAIRLEVDFVRIEQNYGDCMSRLTVYDGYDENAPASSVVCGVVPPDEPIVSSSNVLYLEYSADWVRYGNSFHLNWYQVPRQTATSNNVIKVSECEEEYDLTSLANATVMFSSPGFPDGYANNLDCTWVFTAPIGSHLAMRFIIVDLEENVACQNDYTSVYNGNGLAKTLDDSQLITKVCRSNVTDIIYQAKSVMTVKFHSDFYFNGTGFKAAVWRVCGGELNQPNGVIDFNLTKQMFDPHTFKCEWNITVRQGKTIEVEFSYFKVGNSEAAGCKANYVLLKNGQGLESPLLGTGKFCGKTPPTEELKTIGNKLYVKAAGPWALMDFNMSWREVGMKCGGSYRLDETENQMQFNSPNYPNIPPPFSECFWTFTAPAGGRLSLHFVERFDLTSSSNCEREYVEVRDGGTEHSVFIGRYCGDSAPSTLTTTGNMLYVHFYSEMHDPKNGFKAAVTTGDVCGGILRESSGVIMSPNYPAHYPPSKDCGWWIDGPTDHTLKIEFRDISLPGMAGPSRSRRCSNGDFVRISEKLPFNDSIHTLGTYCGSRKPDVLDTGSNEALISFHTDSRISTQFRGFVLNYTASRESCGGKVGGLTGELKSAGYPNPNGRSRYCKWDITVPEGSQVVLEILDLDIKDSDTQTTYGLNLVISNDLTTRSLLGVVRESPYQKIFYSTSRYMMVGFYYTAGHRGLRARYTATAPVPCGGLVEETSGSLLPPMSPYNNSAFYCQWRLKAPDSMLESENVTRTTLTMWISGTFTSSSQRTTICEYSAKSIHVYDGHQRLGSACGNLSGNTIVIRSPAPINTVDILNGSLSGSINFNVTYEWKSCGGILVGPVHTVRAPDNMAYPRSCVWHARYEDPGAVIRLVFKRINLGNCDTGYIIVRNGGPLSPRVGKYCGNINPGNLTSSANELWIEYWASQGPGDFEISLDVVSGSCGGSIRGANREIVSPGFPIRYPNNAECDWDIIAQPGYSVGLVFVDRFNLEQSTDCLNDYVKIFDWIYDARGVGRWKEKEKLCGRTVPNVFNSTTDRLRILFRSNNAVQGDGFRAIWEENCGGFIEATKNPIIIESPRYPDAYPNKLSCNYTITAPQGKKIWMEILDLEVEGTRGDCRYDNLTIRYHRYIYRDEVLCGTRLPSTLSSDRTANIIFKSDGYVGKRGFRVKIFVNECGGEITEPTEISPPINRRGEYFGSLNCTWVIKAPEGKSVVLRFNKFHLEASHGCVFDRVVIAEGPTLSGRRLAKLCGNVSDPFPIRSTGDTMTVMFRSDSSNHGEGMAASVLFVNSIASGCGGSVDLQGLTPFRTQKTAQYENFQDCHWSISAPTGKMIRLTINTMDLKYKINSTKPGCNGDYLEVREGAGPFSDLIGRYCGNGSVPPIESSMNTLWIRFYTDGSTVGDGVTATLEPFDSPCGKSMWIISNKTEIIQSPGYPGDFVAGIQCRWMFKITGSMFSQLRVHFEELDMEDSQDCNGDHVEISDEVGRYISQDFGEDLVYVGKKKGALRRGRYGRVGTYTYCGKMDPFDYHSGSNEVHVMLKSSTKNMPKPRKFKFEVERASCSRNYTAEQGRIIHQRFQECWTTITAKPGHTISLYFNSFRIFDRGNCTKNFLKIYQGDFGSPDPKIYCGMAEPSPVFSIGNKLSFYSKAQNAMDYATHFYDMLYTTTDKGRGCGGKLFNYEGTFTSPMYPTNYRNDSVCEWDVSVPRGYKVALQFQLFDLGTSDICGTDHMRIVEQNGNTARVELYCPGQIPETFKASGNEVTVTYSSSVNNGGTGWIIHFRAVQDDYIAAPSGTYWRNF